MNGYFEDIVLGETVEIGSHRFTAEEIVSFAERYDPQPFHLDEAAAAESFFGGLCASGWHTGSVCIRLIVEHRQRAKAEAAAAGRRLARSGPSPGFEDLRWIKPVYAGDVISYRATPKDKIILRSRPEWGLLVSLNEGLNQDGELVFSFLGKILVERRPVDAG